MSDGKWTPGPWRINPDFRPGMSWNREIVYGDGKNRICCMAHSDDREPERDEANARLIASAPELYNGCGALLGLIELVLSRSDLSPALREVLMTNHRIDEAKVARAKARGDR